MLLSLHVNTADSLEVSFVRHEWTINFWSFPTSSIRLTTVMHVVQYLPSVKFSLSTPLRRIWRVEVLFHSFFTSALVRGRGRAVTYWLRHYVTNRQVAGSIPDGVIGIFQCHPAGRTMALGSTQPLTEMSTRCISWG
jgi:hypothetical protein